MCHKPRKFLVSCETEELLSFRQTKWTLKKRRGEQGGVRRGSGPKATSGYTRQLNTQQNFKTYKTNWSLFILLINLIYLFLKFWKFLFKKKNTKAQTSFTSVMWYVAFSSLFNALKLKDASAFNCTWAWSILAFGKQAGDSTKIKIGTRQTKCRAHL